MHARRSGGSSAPSSEGTRRPHRGRTAAAVTTALSFLFASVAVLLSGAPVAAAAPPARADATPVTVALACSADASGLVGSTLIQPQQQSVAFAVDAPASVTQGDTYAVTITPGSTTIPSSSGSGATAVTVNHISGFAFRFKIPAGATFASATVNDDGSGDIGGTPTVEAGTGNGVSYLEYDVPGPIAGGATVTFPSVTATFTASGAAGTTLPVQFTGSASTDAATVAPTITPPPGMELTANVTSSTLGATGDVPTQCAEFNGPTTLASTTITTPKTATTTTASADPTSVLTGADVTLSATVAGSGGTPTGTVQFMDGTTTIGAPATVGGSGSAELDNVTFSTAGDHSITAVYSGDDTFAASTSDPVIITVSYPPTDTNTALTAVPASIPSTASTTLTATVTSVSPPDDSRDTPAGSVQFMDGTTALGSPVTVDDTGKASAPETLTGVGDHSLTAVFTPANTADFTGSTSAAFTVSVTPATADTTAITLTDATGRSVVGPDSGGVTAGQPITATATVSSADGQPSTGTVQFQDVVDPDNPVNLGAPVAINANGVATTTLHLYGVTMAGDAGFHQIVGVYSGGGGFGSSTSPTADVATNMVATSTSATPSPTTAAAGAPVAIKVAVTTAEDGLVTGSVDVVDATDPTNPVDLGSATLDGTGSATVTATFATPGKHDLSVNYTSPDQSGFEDSDATASVTVLAAPVTVQVSASPTTVGEWDLDALTASVTGDGTTVPQGTVAFWDGTRFMGSVAVAADGTASWPTGWFETAGDHTVQAVYTPGDDSMYTSGSASTSVTVNPAPAGWPLGGTIQIGPNGQSFPPGAGPVLTDNTYNPSTGALTGRFWGPGVTVSALGGIAVLTLRFGQNNVANGTVNPDGTANLNAVLYAQFRTLSLAGGNAIPLPNCTFEPIVVNLTGTASSTGLDLSASNVEINALDATHCAGLGALISGNFAGSNNSISFHIPGDFTPPTATSIGGVTFDPGSTTAGSSVNATATVSATSGTPTGSVSFVDVTDPTKPVTLGTAAIGPDGQVNTSFVMPTAGTRSVVVKYAGDGGFAPSQADPVSVDVTQDQTTLVLTSSTDSIGLYDLFTLTASVTASPIAPTGTVTFTDETDPDNPITIGSTTIDADGNAVDTVAWLSQPGTRTVVASFAGDTNHTSTTGSTTVTALPAPAGWPVSGSLDLAGNAGSVPDGSLIIHNSYNQQSGVLTGQFWAPAVEVQTTALGGLVNVDIALRFGQNGVATGQVAPDGTVTMDAELYVQMRTLGVTGLLTLNALLPSCTFQPVDVHLTGTATATGLDLSDPDFTIPQINTDPDSGGDPSACAGLAALINPQFAPEGNSNSISLHVDGDFTPPTANGVLVNQLYQAILHRNGDAAGVAYWAGRLDSGTTPQQLATILAKSAEAARIVVTDLYQTALGRTPDAAGLTYWANVLTNGGRPDVLLAMLQASNEAYSNAGGNNIDWVKSLYQQLLGRAADSGGLNYWVAQLATGTSRQAVAMALGATSEAVAFAVNGATTLVCGNPTTGSGFTSLVSAYQASHHNPAVLAGLAAITPCSSPAP